MRVFLILSILFFSFNCFSQDDTQGEDIGKNELRLNVFNFIAFNALEAEYEYLISQESSFGVGVLVGLGNPDDFDLVRNFAITPYYRQFFSRRYARGFFVEGFGMVLNREEAFFEFDSNQTQTETETNVALGISVGGKFLTRGGFVAEVFAGIGRTLINDDDLFFDSVVGRGGISLGYRF